MPLRAHVSHLCTHCRLAIIVALYAHRCLVHHWQEFRRRLRAGEEIPEWFAFESVVKVLRDHQD